jgi:hypothetical protein
MNNNKEYKMTTTKKQKPNKTIFESRKRLEQRLNVEWNGQVAEEHLSILNDYDWSTELFQEGDKYGLKMWDDTILLPAVFDDFRMLTSAEINFGDRVVADMDGKEGVVLPEENNWRWLLQPEFDYISYPNDIVAVKKGEKWGIFCFSQARYLIPIECDSISMYNGFIFCNGIALYKKDGLWGIMNDSGEFTKAIYDDVDHEMEGQVKVKLGEQWGYIKEDATFSENPDDAHFWYTM